MYLILSKLFASDGKTIFILFQRDSSDKQFKQGQSGFVEIITF